MKITYNEMLIDACVLGDLPKLKEEIQNGADIHLNEEQALRFASEEGHLEIVKYLIEKGANIHAMNDLAFRTAVGLCNFDVVKCLVENGADIHVNNNEVFKSKTDDIIIEYLNRVVKLRKI